MKKPVHQVNAIDFTDDFRSGMADFWLAEKYRLTPLGLQKTLKKLVDAGFLEEAEVRSRLLEASTRALVVEKMRIVARRYLAFPIPVYDAANLRTEGTLMDITEKGLKVSGIEVEIGEIRCLLIRADEFQDIYPFAFDARCQWTRREPADQECLAGFEITDISEGSLRELRNLMSTLSFGD